MLILYLIKLRHEVRIFLRYLLCSFFMLYSTLFHEGKILFQIYIIHMWTPELLRQNTVDSLSYNLAYLTLHHDAVQNCIDHASEFGIAPSSILLVQTSLEATRFFIDTHSHYNYNNYDWLDSFIVAFPFESYFTQDLCWLKAEEIRDVNREIMAEMFRLRRISEDYLNYNPDFWPHVGMLADPNITSVWPNQPSNISTFADPNNPADSAIFTFRGLTE